MNIGGIDPGKEGGLAWYCEDGHPGFCHSIRMPVMGKDKLSIIDGGAVVKWFTHRPVDICIVEQAGPMPAQGLGSTFKFGVVYGQVLGVLQAAGIPYKLVRANVWKKDMGLLKQDKEASRRMAIERFPVSADAFALKNSHGRAEAALIALWWSEQLKRKTK